MNKYIDIINSISERLDKISDFSDCNYNSLLSAQKYSLTSGGKHLRGLIVVKCAMFGGVDINKALDFACALEMVHTYSLVHDDLPEMDNDDLRRGKPTCHKKFGADIALLAGDALLTKAFNVVADNNDFDSDVKIDIIRILSQKSGEHGMLAGQTIDKECENKTIDIDLLSELQLRKTGALFVAAVEIGCRLGNVKREIVDKLVEYIKLLGLAFQIKDDILDVTSSQEVLGKPINSDDKCSKSTFVSLYGLEKAKEIMNEKISDAKRLVSDINDPFFIELADYFAKREK